MADTSFGVTPGSGANLHSVTTSIGGTTVHDQVVKPGEPYLASYVVGFANISIATSSAHVLQIMAGASLNVRIRKIFIVQDTLAGTAATAPFIIQRLTTAGTGGSTITARPLDLGDAGAGATAMTIPTAKGTESVFFHRWAMAMHSAHPITAPPFSWEQLPHQKPLIIPAGTSNGIAIKIGTGVASATVSGYVEFDESNF